MKRLCLFLLAGALSLALSAQTTSEFDAHFVDSTLRVDYIFSGTNHTQHIALAQLSKTAGWYGRRRHLGSLPGVFFFRSMSLPDE